MQDRVNVRSKNESYFKEFKFYRRTTRSCRHKALLFRIEGGFQYKKNSRLARRAEPRRQRHSRLHSAHCRIVMAKGPMARGQPTLR